MTTFTWPDWYPENCPPSDAVAASGVVYRLVKGPEVAESDFTPLYQQSPSRVRDGLVCMASGLSTYRDQADADYLRRNVRAFRQHLIAAGTIDGAGQELATPRDDNSHVPRWVPIDDEPWNRFALSDGGDA